VPKPASITQGNDKLGALIYGWSLPAGEKICIGASALCAFLCYAKSGFFRMRNVKQSHMRNYLFSLTDEFATWTIATIVSLYIRVVRIHVGGDFYSVEYVEKWIEIAEACPKTRFFAYTRSWRDEECLPALIRLAALPNVELWWSMDRETGSAPLIRGIRRAYLAVNDIDAKHAPDDCDLVFRDEDDTVMKKANGVQVCPVENGVKTKVPITCSSCGICWNKADTKWEGALSPYLEADHEILAPEVKDLLHV